MIAEYIDIQWLSEIYNLYKIINYYKRSNLYKNSFITISEYSYYRLVQLINFQMINFYVVRSS